LPATTTRGYPYSLPADPADIPGALEAFASAVDTDVQARADSVHARPMFRLSSTSNVVYYPYIVFTQARVLPFETQDAMVGDAIAPVSGSLSRVTPLLPGYWFFHASMSYPRSGATSMDLIGVSIQTASATLARNSTHVAPPQSDGANNIAVSAGTYMNGTTDYIQVVGTAHSASSVVGVPSLIVRRRYLLGIRMTDF